MLSGKFLGQSEMRPIIPARPGKTFAERLSTRATTGGADLEIVWGVTKQYGSGPDYAIATVTLMGGLAVTFLFGMVMAGLIKRNRVINEKVDQATTALQRKSAELARAHELVRRAFGRYVSEEVAESLLRSPEALDLGGEEREATILMSDLRGFTAMVARLTPHEAFEVLNLYLEAMVDVVGRYQGTIDEIMGDAVVVIFGAPVACAEHAEKAVACGLAMQLAMADVNRRLTAKGAPELEMGIGIHTGRMIVGNIGSVRRTKYTAVGTSVNLVGRIESFTIGGQVLVSEDTLEKITATLRIDGQFEVEPKGASRRLFLYEIGGIGEPFDLWLPPKTKPLRPLALPLPIQFTVLEEKFVGRTVHDGHVTALTDLEASIRSALPLAVLSNLRITVTTTSHDNPAGEIYGKVVEPVADASGETRIRFTSITPELKAWAAALASTRVREKETEATFRPGSAVRRAPGQSLLRDHEAV
jgi:adenylate cyclase